MAFVYRFRSRVKTVILTSAALILFYVTLRRFQHKTPEHPRQMSYIKPIRPFWCEVLPGALMDDEPCSNEVKASAINISVYPPKQVFPSALRSQTDDSLEWIVYGTKCTLGLNRLIKMLASKSIKTTVLGYGSFFCGWGQRVRELHDYLITVPDERIIVWSDGNDVLMLPGASRNEIIRRYHTSNAAILFGSEKACWPRGELWQNFTALATPPSPTTHLYLNAGFMIGKAKYMRALTRFAYTHDTYDDQLMYALNYLSRVSYKETESGKVLVTSTNQGPIPDDYQQLIKLDWHQSIVMNMYDVHYHDINILLEEGLVQGKELKSYPLVLHHNGEKQINHVLEEVSRDFQLPYRKLSTFVFPRVNSLGLPADFKSKVKE